MKHESVGRSRTDDGRKFHKCAYRIWNDDSPVSVRTLRITKYSLINTVHQIYFIIKLSKQKYRIIFIVHLKVIQEKNHLLPKWFTLFSSFFHIKHGKNSLTATNWISNSVVFSTKITKKKTLVATERDPVVTGYGDTV